MFIDSEQFLVMAEDLLYKRIADWFSKMEEYATEKPSFFAVGAGHLGSEKGVLALLRKQGYKITPVKN